MTSTVSPRGASLCGKIPIRLDFVSFNCQYEEAIALDEWLGREVAESHRTGTALPAHRARFLLTFPGRATSLLGVLEPSHDQAGRKFPAAVFAPLAREQVATAFGALPFVGSRFWNEAETLLGEVAGLSYEDLKTRLQSLAGPAETGFEEAQGRLQTALDNPAADFARRVFGQTSDETEANAAAGFAELARACRSHDAPILRCPATDEADVAICCEMLRTANGAPPTPCLWWKRPEGPVWISLSRDPAGQLALLSGGTTNAPLVSPSPSASSDNSDSIEAIRHVLDGGSTRELVAHLAR